MSIAGATPKAHIFRPSRRHSEPYRPPLSSCPSFRRPLPSFRRKLESGVVISRNDDENQPPQIPAKAGMTVRGHGIGIDMILDVQLDVPEMPPRPRQPHSSNGRRAGCGQSMSWPGCGPRRRAARSARWPPGSRDPALYGWAGAAATPGGRRSTAATAGAPLSYF